MEAEQRSAQARREKRAETIRTLTEDFDRSVSGMLDTVSTAAGAMNATSQGMSANAEQTNHQASSVAAAAEESTASVQTVAAAAEELSGSIHEISRQVSQSNDITRSASEDARRANEMVNGLGASSNKIGEVVSLINNIAAQITCSRSMRPLRPPEPAKPAGDLRSSLPRSRISRARPPGRPRKSPVKFRKCRPPPSRWLALSRPSSSASNR